MCVLRERESEKERETQGKKHQKGVGRTIPRVHAGLGIVSVPTSEHGKASKYVQNQVKSQKGIALVLVTNYLRLKAIIHPQ